MNRTIAAIAFVALCISLASFAQGPAALAPSTRAASLPASQGVIKLDHMRVDRKNRTVSIDAVVCYSPQPLEVFLCKQGTKDYESVLSTKALPSHIHAGLLMLGLTPGKPVAICKASCANHPPHMIAPQGPKLAITMKWTDANGVAHQAAAADWLINNKDANLPAPKEWIFIGSDVMPDGGYWADGDGDIICTSNFASAVIDVPFPSTADNSQLALAGNEKAIPPKDTAVEVILTAMPGAQNDPVARVTLDIDPQGRYWIDGKAHTAEQLIGWADQYTDRHADGQVVLRARPGAPAYYVEIARGNLRIGGVLDFADELLLPRGELTPRTAEQAQALLADWQARLAKPNAILNPFEEAQAHLKHLQHEMDELDRQRALLAEYGAQLTQQFTQAQAATRPAKP